MEENKAPELVSKRLASNTNQLTGKTISLNLDYGMAAVLCYCPIFALNIIFSIVFLATEPQQSKFVRFHALQALMLFGSSVALCFASMLGTVLSFIPFIGGLIAFGLGLFTWFYLGLTVFVSFFLMYKANNKEMTKLPILGHYADQYSSETSP